VSLLFIIKGNIRFRSFLSIGERILFMEDFHEKVLIRDVRFVERIIIYWVPTDALNGAL
jgi:hypothetical protein